LARLFLQKRDLWLLDEPTENIDSGTARDILERMSASFFNSVTSYFVNFYRLSTGQQA